MAEGESLIFMIGFVGIIVSIALSIALAYKAKTMQQLQSTAGGLKKSLDEMDEQAKLIVRTDIELNKTQEELDKKINSLYALQKLSRAISTTLQENRIFSMLNANDLEGLGFEKACGFLWSEKEKCFTLRFHINCTQEEIIAIQNHIASYKDWYMTLIEREKTVSSISLPDVSLNEKIKSIFKALHFIISPILTKELYKGFLAVATENADMSLNEGDEELITILANQIGQALENAHLFEKTWQAQQELEKKVEERTHELTLALDEVKKISKRKTDFISSVSHELRTPLTSIKGYAAILIAEKLGQLPEAVKERLEKINRHSDELVRMVNDLLDIARIESGRAAMKIEPQNLKDIVAAAADLILIQCKNKNISLVTDVQAGLAQVLADRSQIERVFINLLGNAVKFTPSAGKITLKAYARDNNVQVEVSDTGIGIPAESLPMIFDEFYRVDNSVNEQLKGTGLGLSLVKHIVEAHQGKIWTESHLGKGTKFTFTLPKA